MVRAEAVLDLPGVRLDGVLGYNILARYRMEFDLGKSTMTWTELDFDPQLPEPLRGDGPGGGPPELEMIGNLMQGMGAMLRRPDPPATEPRGFLGIELTERDGSIIVQSVLGKSPADVQAAIEAMRAELVKNVRIARYVGNDFPAQVAKAYNELTGKTLPDRRAELEAERTHAAWHESGR